MSSQESATQFHLQPFSEGSQYRFGNFRLGADGTLFRHSIPIPITPKELAVLRLLLANAGKVVPAKLLRESVWSDVHVSAASLPRCVSSLRNRLGSEDCIQTLYKRGYLFRIPVQETPADHSPNQWIERRVALTVGAPRVAVLPFATLEGVPEFFGPGIAEEAMLRLSRRAASTFQIIARDSVFACAANGLSTQETGIRLGADLVVAGTISALPAHFRLRAEMVRVSDNTQTWIEDFLLSRELLEYADARMAKRIAARIQNTFARPVVSITAAKPLTGESLGISPSATVDRTGEAYTTFLEARHQWNTLKRPEMQNALHGLKRAADLDNSLLSARVHLLHSYLTQSSFGFMRPDTAANLAVREAENILSISPRYPSVYPALGWIHFHHSRNMADALEAFGHSEPSAYNPRSTHYRARFALGRGRFSEAIELLRAGVEIDPYSPWLQGRLAWALHLSGDGAAAVRHADHSLELFPHHPGILFFSAQIFSTWVDPGSERFERAKDLAHQLTEIADFGPVTLAYLHVREDQLSEARAILSRQQWQSRENFLLRSFHVPVLVALGEYDAALRELAIADELHCAWFFELLLDPRLRPLHSFPEFQRFDEIVDQMESACESVA
jgi:DNA-binding winged helix-turn-helix (wHTH) protein/tetratricopeptide (TPR) repeat protein